MTIRTFDKRALDRFMEETVFLTCEECGLTMHYSNFKSYKGEYSDLCKSCYTGRDGSVYAATMDYACSPHTPERKKQHVTEMQQFYKEKAKERGSFEYHEWRQAVLERDDHTCMKCKQGGDVAHHIESFDMNIDIRTEVSNGITLCKDCHEDFHRRYGKGNNTYTQLLEFMLC